MKKEIIKCERCGEVLNPKKAKWLELSNTDGNYYIDLPEGHVSQGGFSFGVECATKQVKETINELVAKMTDQKIYANRLRIGSRIVEIRGKRKVSQEELASRTGLTQGNISRIEHGKYSVTLDVLFKIAQGLNCEIALILK